MGTVWETLAVYGLQGALWFGALYRFGAKPAVVMLGISLMLSWWLGELLDGNDRKVAMIMVDLVTVLALQQMHVGAHERLVAALALLMIAWRGFSHLIAPGMERYAYAVVLNCIVVLQLLIAGGWIDDWGRALDDRLDRLHPRLARALRHVAT